MISYQDLPKVLATMKILKLNHTRSALSTLLKPTCSLFLKFRILYLSQNFSSRKELKRKKLSKVKTQLDSVCVNLSNPNKVSLIKQQTLSNQKSWASRTNSSVYKLLTSPLLSLTKIALLRLKFSIFQRMYLILKHLLRNLAPNLKLMKLSFNLLVTSIETSNTKLRSTLSSTIPKITS